MHILLIRGMYSVIHGNVMHDLCIGMRFRVEECLQLLVRLNSGMDINDFVRVCVL